MTTETIIANTKQMIDDLKTVCANFGLIMQVVSIKSLQKSSCINF